MNPEKIEVDNKGVDNATMLVYGALFNIGCRGDNLNIVFFRHLRWEKF